MQLFKKSKFLQKIKESFPNLSDIRISECTYHHTHNFSEWLEFEYGNYYYVFYHAKRWGNEKLTYRKSNFDARCNRQKAPFEIKEVLLKNKTLFVAAQN